MLDPDRLSAVAPHPIAGALAGLAAGLIASYLMTKAQALLPSPPENGSAPSTEVVADKVHVAAKGEPVPHRQKEAAGEAVHYALGAVLGVGYGVAAEYFPGIKRGVGVPFGITVALALDEVAVPVLGLSKPSWQFGARTHLFSLASHAVFGASNEIARRLLRSHIS